MPHYLRTKPAGILAGVLCTTSKWQRLAEEEDKFYMGLSAVRHPANHHRNISFTCIDCTWVEHCNDSIRSSTECKEEKQQCHAYSKMVETEVSL